MTEIWKDIEGYEGLYQVSNMGGVKGKKGALKGYKKKGDYLYVTLSKNGKTKSQLLHRLVAQTFIPNPDNLPQVNHKDEDKTNNRVENLEWCSPTYNINYGNRNWKCSNATSMVVRQYDLKMNLIGEFTGTNEAERQTGISHSSISACCKGKLKTAGKYIWRYK